jgi:hypothetical protein
MSGAREKDEKERNSNELTRSARGCSYQSSAWDTFIRAVQCVFPLTIGGVEPAVKTTRDHFSLSSWRIHSGVVVVAAGMEEDAVQIVAYKDVQVMVPVVLQGELQGPMPVARMVARDMQGLGLQLGAA